MRYRTAECVVREARVPYEWWYHSTLDHHSAWKLCQFSVDETNVSPLTNSTLVQLLLLMLRHKLRPQTIGKVFRPSGGLYWSDNITQLVLELLAHRTPPSCISSNILSVAKVILPNSDVIHQLTGVELICFCRGTLSYLTKILVSYELAIVPKFLE